MRATWARFPVWRSRIGRFEMTVAGAWYPACAESPHGWLKPNREKARERALSVPPPPNHPASTPDLTTASLSLLSFLKYNFRILNGMKYVPRRLGPQIEKAARHFPAIILTGPRRAGKTTLLRRLLPRASYWLAEDPDVIARIRSDPRGFLMELRPPVILDEIQHV